MCFDMLIAVLLPSFSSTHSLVLIFEHILDSNLKILGYNSYFCFCFQSLLTFYASNKRDLIPIRHIAGEEHYLFVVDISETLLNLRKVEKITLCRNLA